MEFMRDFIEYKENEEKNYKFTVFREKTVNCKNTRKKIKNPINSHVSNFLKWERDNKGKLEEVDREARKFKTPCLRMNTFNKKEREEVKFDTKNALKELLEARKQGEDSLPISNDDVATTDDQDKTEDGDNEAMNITEERKG